MLCILCRRFSHMTELSDDHLEVERQKSRIRLDCPITVGMFVLDYAKLKMLSFYYDFLLKYIDFSKFCVVQMDTDSLYMGLATSNLLTSVSECKRAQFIQEYEKWMAREYCDSHKSEFFLAGFTGSTWVPNHCCYQAAKFASRTPGLFHIEYHGDSIVALASKCYYCSGGSAPKISSKGISKKHNKLSESSFTKVLNNRQIALGVNKGFRNVKNGVYTYIQNKKGLNYFYGKRIVCSNGVNTLPTHL